MIEKDNYSWEMIHSNPAAFFGLEKHFSITELDAAYQKCLEIFSQESHPEQHKLIIQTRTQLIRKRKLAAIHPEESTLEAYQRIASLDEKNKHHYIVLSVMTQVLKTAVNESSLDWLILSIKEYDEDEELIDFLKESLNDYTHEEYMRWLPKIAEAIPKSIFYSLTLSCWKQLAVKLEFKEWHRLLNSCEAFLKEDLTKPGAHFFLQVMRKIYWKADEQWLRERDKCLQVSDVFSSKPKESFFWDALKAYRKDRTHFLDGSELRMRMDQAVIDYCTLDSNEGDRRFLETLNYIQDNPKLILNLSITESNDFNSLYNLYETIAKEISERRGMIRTGFPQVHHEFLIRNLLRQIKQQQEMRIRPLITLKTFGFLACFYVIFRFFPSPEYHSFLNQVPTFLKEILLGLFFLLLWKETYDFHLLHWWYNRFPKKTIKETYHQMWRPLVARFLRETHLPLDTLKKELAKISDREIHLPNDLEKQLLEDAPLKHYALALAMT